jgi:prepilin-type N-terminal cleavage/methylation domain-containing protein
VRLQAINEERADWRMRGVSRVEGADGFSLVELLVVMIVIGVLAAIAIPIFLTQRAKARDAATQSDVSRVGKEIAAYYVDGQGPVVLAYTAPAGGHPATIAVTDAGGYDSGALPLSAGTVRPVAGASAHLDSSTTWCVALTNPDGSQQSYSYSGDRSLQRGVC